MLAFAPLDGAVGAAAHIVTALATAVEPFAGTAATAVAIVLFTVLVRLLISPLSWAQIRGERRRTALAPRIRDLQRRYGDRPDRLRAELVALHREAGASPVAGCLPALAQGPFFFVMYRLFAVPDDDGGSAGLLAERLFGVPLGQQFGDGLAGAAGPLFGVLLGLLVLLAWWSSRRMRRAAALGDPGTAPAAGGDPGTAPVAAALARIMPLLPYGTVLVALLVPLAAVLYLVTTTAWTGLEQVVLRRGGTSTTVDMRGPGTYNS
ncbi:YidC/Oxa1 family membrane protein insertase [Plantactinospora soyae]|uniref:Membrane protein insertase YidC n=1 Tax=Plantactinospora soyae TaxID=1544732 RepID=A0A927R579_9ACTN|nr:membrane protein insertase YidC [Plantactinospora soyae]MBE1487244.1 YidC/Oxa1 family membrane protein insertase [Plantactinospora soyae]